MPLKILTKPEFIKSTGGLVHGSSYTNSRQMTVADQVPVNAASTAVSGEPPVGSTSSAKMTAGASVYMTANV